MEVRRRLAAAVTAGILWVGGVTAAAAQPNLREVAERLDLTAAGSGRWLEALGVAGSPRKAHERLLALSSAGTVVATRDGVESSVSLGLELDLLLLTRGSAIVLVHNHPANAGLSANDLSQLEKPGVAAVVAIGHDGSIYMAARGRRYDDTLFEELQYAAVRAEIRKRLRIECGSGALSVAVADAHFSHLAALSLAKAGVIEYEAVLAGATRTTFEAARVTLTRIALGAASAAARATK